MNIEEPVKLLSTAGVARRLDVCHATCKKKLLEHAIRADGISLPGFGWLFNEERLPELRQAVLGEPQPVSVDTQPGVLS